MNHLLPKKKKKHENRTFYEFFQWELGFGFIWSFETNSRDWLPAYYLWKLILPALRIITSRVYGRKQENQLSLLSLSSNTVKRRIEDMAKNIEETLILLIQNSQVFFITSGWKHRYSRQCQFDVLCKIWLQRLHSRRFFCFVKHFQDEQRLTKFLS
jgi:hypothetical protein